ncbi:MAG TPA: type II toxin-antitoxin system RelE/ParE family toxin [Candidatus Kapabacteria bacterium]
MTTILHPAALEEMLRAARYYAKISAKIARNFRAEVEEALEEIGHSPNRYPESRKGFRVRMLKRYHYSIIYDFDAEKVRVYAIAHHKRRPGYWTRRKFV